MRVQPYDGARPRRSMTPVEKTVRPLRTIALGGRRELRLSTVTSARGASVALRVYVRDSLGELISPGQALFVYAEQIPGVLAALTEAAAIFAGPTETASTDTPEA